MSSTSRSRRTRPASPPVSPASRMARAADLAGDEVRRLATRPGVRRAVRRAGEVARGTASRLPRQRDEITLLASDLAGVATTGILVDGAQAAQARRTARSLGLPRTMDSVSAWNALGALAALIQVADDGRRRAVVIDASGPRSVFSRWATAAGFAPVALDVAEPEVVGERIDAGAADLVALLYPRTVDPADLDVELAHASRAVRKGGLVCSTVQLGPERTGGLGVADLRAFMARAGEQGLATVGNLDLQDAARARAAQSEHQDRPVGLALLTFRRT